MVNTFFQMVNTFFQMKDTNLTCTLITKALHYQHGMLIRIAKFGGLHIMELAALITPVNLLESSRWAGLLVQAGVAASGKEDSFLKASHKRGAVSTVVGHSLVTRAARVRSRVQA